MDEERDIGDVIIEYIEIFLNHILYVRELYPKQIFRKCQIYNCLVYMSMYPPLNQYLMRHLMIAQDLKRNNSLRKLQLIILSKDMTEVYERYSFDIDDDCQNRNDDNNNSDTFLIKFEEDLRKSFLTLKKRISVLDKLPKGETTFKIRFHTKENEYIRLTHNPDFQNFPLVEVDKNDPLEAFIDDSNTSTQERKRISILPLATAYTTGIQVFAEKC